MPQAAPVRSTVCDPDAPAKRAWRPQPALEAQKRAFMRMVSHELRTPLNSIIGFSEIISRELAGPLGAPQYREYAENVLQSGLKLLRLVDQLLEMARLEGPGADLETVAEPLDAALDDVQLSLRARAAARRVRLVIRDEGRLPAVSADPRGLRTLLANLLENAIAYSPERGEVRISAERTANQVRIRIEDDGEGVDPADIPRLMRPFEQGETALTRSRDGAGLGLPICALLCRAMGGTLRLASAPGQGLAAEVTLPAA